LLTILGYIMELRSKQRNIKMTENQFPEIEVGFSPYANRVLRFRLDNLDADKIQILRDTGINFIQGKHGVDDVLKAEFDTTDKLAEATRTALVAMMGNAKSPEERNRLIGNAGELERNLGGLLCLEINTDFKQGDHYKGTIQPQLKAMALAQPASIAPKTVESNPPATSQPKVYANRPGGTPYLRSDYKQKLNLETSPPEVYANRPGGQPYLRSDHNQKLKPEAKRPSGEFRHRGYCSSPDGRLDMDVLLQDVKKANPKEMAQISKDLAANYPLNSEYYNGLKDSVQKFMDQNSNNQKPGVKELNDKLGQLSEVIDRGRLNEQARGMMETAFDAAKSKPATGSPQKSTTRPQAPPRP